MKFSLRDVFWAVLMMALSLGWWVDRTVRKAPPVAGRYQMLLDKDGNPVVVDTATGESWMNPRIGPWVRRRPPWEDMK